MSSISFFHKSNRSIRFYRFMIGFILLSMSSIELSAIDYDQDNLSGQLDSTQLVEATLTRLTSISSEEERLDSLYTWAIAGTDTELMKSLILAKLGMEYSKNSVEHLSDFTMLAGRNSANLGLFDQAESYFNQYLQLAKEHNIQKKIAAGLHKLSFVSNVRGEFESSFTYLMEALRAYEKIDNRFGQADVLTDLSTVLANLNRYEDALTYARRAIEALDDENHELMLVIYENTAHAYLGLEDYDNALKEMKKALALADKLDVDLFSMATLQNSLGNVYKHLKDYDQAIEAYKISNKIATDLEIPGGILATLGNIADVYSQKGDYAGALVSQREGMQVAAAYGFNDNHVEHLADISSIFENLNQYDSALHYHKLHLMLYDSLLSLEKDQVTKELSAKYETEKKETMISQQQQELSRQRLMQFLGFGLFALTLGFLFLLYRNYRQKQKGNARLAEANRLLESKNNENELLLKEIHHRVKNNLQTISSLLSLQSRSINDPTALDAVNESKNRVASMALIHQKLYQRDNLAAIEMRDYFQTIGKTILKSFGGKAKHIALDVDMDELELDVDTAVPIGLITNELITNSIKHAFPDQNGGAIDVSIKADDQNYNLIIKDNGIGGQLNQTGNATAGFGKMLVNILTQQLGGTLREEINQGRATIISFPKAQRQVA